MIIGKGDSFSFNSDKNSLRLLENCSTGVFYTDFVSVKFNIRDIVITFFILLYLLSVS